MSKAGESGLKSVRERVEEARRALDEAVHKAGEIASDFADDAVAGSRRAARVVVREVKEHPIATLAAGAAVGVLIAALLMRRRD
jgi:ElaB/YqjD/DUF883 family membrane-anchored ribosome-binding protein